VNIYKTTNLISGKIYIGQETNFNRYYYGSGLKIKKAIKKYGKSNFNKEIICYCENKIDMDEKEKFFIKAFDVTNKLIGYNIAEGGEGGPFFKGHHHTKKTKENMSKHRKTLVGPLSSMYGKKHSEETKKKWRENRKGKLVGPLNGMYGKTHTEMAKKKMSRPHWGSSNGMYGKKHSEECKSHLRQIMTGIGNPFFGKRHTDKTKNIIRLRMLKGNKLPTKEEFSVIYHSRSNAETALYFNIHETTVDRWRKLFNVSSKRNTSTIKIDSVDLNRDRGGGFGSTGI